MTFSNISNNKFIHHKVNLKVKIQNYYLFYKQYCKIKNQGLKNTLLQIVSKDQCVRVHDQCVKIISNLQLTLLFCWSCSWQIKTEAAYYWKRITRPKNSQSNTFHIRATLCPLASVWFRSTDTIASVRVYTISKSLYQMYKDMP